MRIKIIGSPRDGRLHQASQELLPQGGSFSISLPFTVEVNGQKKGTELKVTELSRGKNGVYTVTVEYQGVDLSGTFTVQSGGTLSDED